MLFVADQGLQNLRALEQPGLRISSARAISSRYSAPLISNVVKNLARRAESGLVNPQSPRKPTER
jgi:hypothetical protein